MKAKMLLGAIVFMAAMLAGASLLTASILNPGAADIMINGGDKGNVPFPHKRHQDTLIDCNLCHELFPQKAGSIDALKAEGKLKSKQVMNKQCISCHRKYKDEGKKFGPTGCTQCHQK